MSQSARQDPEGYRQREGEHKPYEPVKATKPKATDGDRELTAKMMLDRPDESRVMPLIASHVAGRLAPVEAERDELRATVAKMREALGLATDSP